MKNEKATKKVKVNESLDLQAQGYLLLENYVEDEIRYHELYNPKESKEIPVTKSKEKGKE